MKQKKKQTQPKATQFKQINQDVRSEQIMVKINHLKSILMLDNHVDVFIPNEIFSDFQSSSLFKNWQQVALAYSFYYVSCYLYRNCIYAKLLDIKQVSTTSIRKDILGVAGKQMDDVYKDGGILDQLGYFVTHNDFPIIAIQRKNGKLDGFETYSDLKKSGSFKGTFPPNVKFKFPVKAFYKMPFNNLLEMFKQRQQNEEYAELLGYTDGHFFDVSSSHKIQIETFIACLSNPKLGYKGFYLYGFYRRQSDFYKGGYNASIEQIQKIIPISKNTLTQYHNELESLGLIDKTVYHKKPTIYRAKNRISTIKI